MLEASRKRKGKAKPSLKNRFTELFQPVPIDFIAYLPLEECAIRLESCDKQNWWRSARTYVTITPVDAVSYAFHIRRKRLDIGTFEAHGYLQDGEDGGTHVTGEVIASFKVSVSMTIVIGVILLALIFNFDDALRFFVFTLIFGPMTEVSIRAHYSHDLAEAIETTLGY